MARKVGDLLGSLADWRRRFSTFTGRLTGLAGDVMGRKQTVWFGTDLRAGCAARDRTSDRYRNGGDGPKAGSVPAA
ncbi:hypothetical protein AJ87_41850 [Rhizobium yanglingense]|nr:hypothetical protein AJ87_41850 [Rhizobium yanglingense]